MKLQRLLLIVNPISGTNSKTEIVQKIETKLQAAGIEVDTVYTEGPGHATRLAADAAAGGYYHAVGVCGGDGTVNEAACGLCDTDLPLAILPSGSGNGLARHIGLAPDELAAVDFIKEENIRECDYGDLDGRNFFCAFGVGFDAAVAKKFAEDSHRGKATYIKNTILEFSKFQPKEFEVTIDGSTTFTVKAYLIACCNASQYGNNAFIAPMASITDGVLDVIIMKDAPHIQSVLVGLDMLTGMLPYNRQIQIIKAKTVRIVPKEHTPAHVDGEPIEPQLEYNIAIHPGRLRLFCNPAKKKFTPFITPIDYMTKDITAAVNKFLADIK